MKKIILQMLLVIASIGFAQAQTKITGTITDATNGEPLPYATVSVKGITTSGQLTDDDGNYSITLPAGAKTLVISYMGYTTQEVEVGQRSIINVALASDAIELEGAIAVAYGVARKESYTGSAAVVKGDKLQKRSVSNVTKAIDGLTPGVITTSGGGQPGSGSSIQIRGWGSIKASTSPLIVVDNIPFDGAMSSINPNDIESMSILKDASAGALYGARGANGVIMITTKKGAKDRLNIHYKGTYGVKSRSLKRYDLTNQREFVEITYEAIKNAYVYNSNYSEVDAQNQAVIDLGNKFGGEAYNPFKSHTWATLIDPATGKVKADAVSVWDEDWMNEITKNGAATQEHVFSIAGGTDKVQHMLSLGYLEDKGVLKSTQFNRYSVRANVDYQAKFWMKVGANLSYSYTKSNYSRASGTQTANAWYTAQFMAPIYPMYMKDAAGKDLLGEDGQRQLDYGTNRPKASNFNVLGGLLDNKALNNRDNLGLRTNVVFGSDSDEAGVLKGLKLAINFGGDLVNQNVMNYGNMFHGDAAASNGSISKSNTRVFSYTFNQLLTYNKRFDKHSLDVLLGHEYYDNRDTYLYASRTNLFAGIYELAPGVNLTGASSYSNLYRIEGYLSRLNYGFDDKYYISASYRTDGSSRFHKDNRWGQFWSLGASWRISEENFMKNIDFLNSMTIKASYGSTGNDDLGSYYAWQSFYSLEYKNNINPGAIITSLENKKVSWETINMLNLGVEASMFKRRLNIGLEVYDKKTVDMLLSFPMAMSTGFTGFNDNVGDLSNRGIELSVQGVIMDKENFSWRSTLNLSAYKNKVLKLTETKSITSGIYVTQVGLPVNSFYMNKSAGVDPATGKQLYWAYEFQKNDEGEVIVDYAGNPKKVEGSDYITSDKEVAKESKYLLGSRHPKLVGSFGSDFTIFKNFDLSFLTSFSIGGKTYDGVYSGIMEPTYAGDQWSKHAYDRRWREPGQITDVPIALLSSSRLGTDRSLVNASYFAIRNVTLGYTLPEKWTKKLDIKSLRVFCTLDNIYTFTYLNGMDPQANFSGSTGYSYAPVRSVSIGLDINF